MLIKTLLVIVLSVSGVLSQRGWGVTYTPERICALKGSSVNMSCTYSYPPSHTVQKTFWVIYDWNSKQEGEDLSKDSEYSHRVEYLGNKNSDCTFRINQLRETDSGTYRFRFLTDHVNRKYTSQLGVTLEVTDLQVMVNPDTVTEGQSVRLTCSSTCTLTGSPAFIWYRDGSPLPFTDQILLFTARTEDAGKYSCAVKGYEHLRSPAVALDVICVLSQRGWRVTYTPERICALKWSSVDMSCTYSYPTSHTVQKTFCFIHWNKPQEPEDLSFNPEYSHRVEYLGDKKSNCTFRINQLRKNDSKTYRFRFLTNCDGGKYTGEPGVTLEVTDLQVMVNPDTVTEGQSVRLICSTTCTLTGSPAFIWYRDGSPLSFTDQSHQFTASSEDRGSYTCAVKGYELHSPAVALNVIYRPKSISVSVSPSGEIVEGSSVTLICSSDGNPPVQRYTWYKNNRAVSPWGGSDRSYTIKTITLLDAGVYYCEARNVIGAERSPPKHLDVQYPPKSVSVSVTPSGEIVEGSSVTLTCSSDANPPVQRHTWYKNNGNELSWKESSYTIKSITLQDAGEYYCEAENAIGTKRSQITLKVLYPPKNTSISASPSGEIEEGSSLTLTCSSDANPSVQNYTWVKKNDTGVWQAGSGQSLNFSNFRSWNRGQYCCEAQNSLGAQNASAILVTVQGGQSLIVAAAVGVAEILALVFLGVCLRRRKSTNETEEDRQGNKSPIDGNVSGMAMSHTGTQDTDRDDGHQPHP